MNFKALKTHWNPIQSQSMAYGIMYYRLIQYVLVLLQLQVGDNLEHY